MVHQYDNIPRKYIKGNILEIGVNLNRLLSSKIGDLITTDNYLGLDIESKNEDFRIIQSDFITYELEDTYQTILMIEVLEHISLAHWEDIVTKLKNGLKPGGWLILTVPYKQLLSVYVHSTDMNLSKPQIHTIFGINKKVMRKFFPGAKTKMLYRFFIRDDNCSRVWAIGRFFKRFFFGGGPSFRNLMVCWQK